MDVLETFQNAAQELVSLAQQRGIDLEPFRHDFTFLKEHRWIYVWRKNSLPGTGPANEPLGTLHYSLQGKVAAVPESFRASAGAFRGRYHEAGTLADLEQAFELLKAWLIDRKDTDDLPQRFVRSEGIG